jgi:hypothetical protein
MATPEEIIARYKAAYGAINPNVPQVDYWRGWYSIAHRGIQVKMRGKDMIAAAEAFEARA